MQALKDRKDAIELIAWNPDPVVADGEFPSIREHLCPHVNFGRGVALELQRVADQVLEDLDQVRRAGPDGGERIMSHLRVTFPYRGGEILHGLLKHEFTVGLFKGLAFRPDPRVFQQVANEALHTGGAIDGVADKFIGVLIQLAPVSFPQ